MTRIMLALALGLVSHTGMAADFTGGDADKGKAKAAVCAACHGADGNSMNAEWPKLAGQHANYTLAQLKAFKSGARKDPVMMGQVAALSEADMADLAAFYASQALKPGVADPEQVETAQAIYRGGNADAGVPACAACHGPQGLGNAAASYPQINGQHATYTANELKAYRSGERSGTDAAMMMSNVAAGLSDADIQALASYLAGLH